MKIKSILLNLICGFLFGCLIGKVILNSKTYVGPSSKNIKTLIYKDKNNNCFKLSPQIHICPISLSMSNKFN